jgi:hypothetical protein
MARKQEFTPEAKERRKKYAREWRRQFVAKNRDAVNAKQKEYRKSNPERTKAYDKKQYHKHKDKNREAKLLYARQYREAHAETLKPKMVKYLKTRRCKIFGISLQEWERMHADQGGVCAICSRPDPKKSLSVDHSHSTGKVRGLLCGNCNLALGQFRDSADILESAASYLRKHSCVQTQAAS